MSGNVCFVDTETTGLLADRHEIWEVGLILPDGGEDKWLLQLDQLPAADPIALGIGRFHERHPQGNEYPPSPFQLIELTSKFDFARVFAKKTHGLHLAGAVVSFDAERLTKLLHGQYVVPSWHYHLIDVEALAVGFIAGCRRGIADAGSGEVMWAGTPTMHAAEGPAGLPWDSKELSAAVGVDVAQFRAHEALEDARWAKAIYEAVMS